MGDKFKKFQGRNIKKEVSLKSPLRVINGENVIIIAFIFPNDKLIYFICQRYYMLSSLSVCPQPS